MNGGKLLLAQNPNSHPYNHHQDLLACTAFAVPLVSDARAESPCNESDSRFLTPALSLSLLFLYFACEKQKRHSLIFLPHDFTSSPASALPSVSRFSMGSLLFVIQMLTRIISIINSAGAPQSAWE